MKNELPWEWVRMKADLMHERIKWETTTIRSREKSQLMLSIQSNKQDRNKSKLILAGERHKLDAKLKNDVESFPNTKNSD